MRHYEGSAVLAHALERSFSALLVPLFFLGLMCICMAGIIYYVEGVRRTPHAAPAPRERRVWGGGQGGGQIPGNFLIFCGRVIIVRGPYQIAMAF